MEKDILKSRMFIRKLTESAAYLPFSFEYDGKTFHGLDESWRPRVQREMEDSLREKTIVTGCAPDSSLRVVFELVEYRDHSVCEWIVWFENTGCADTSVLSMIRSADLSFPSVADESPRLWHGIGENHEGKNYSFQTDILKKNEVLTFTPEGGRPCDNAFPYFRILDKQGGYFIAIGWPGQWIASFENQNGNVCLKAGQKTVDFYLKPGERVRTPRMTVLSFEGSEEYAVNLWRDWYRTHILPRMLDGGTLAPKLCGYARRIEDNEHCSETEQTQLAFIRSAHERGFHFDTWWIDAGWYECSNDWWHTGLWKCDPLRFPNGLTPISDELKKEATELLLWFEPERIARNEHIFREHPDFVLTTPSDEKMNLLNLANPKCVQFLSEYISGFIKQNGIGVYRQDFNFNPMPYWKHQDSLQGEHRFGITENLYVQGYLAYWDFLLADNPGLWIDSCSSGGRRNDLETMRRSVPLHYSDYGYRLYDEKQRYHHVLYEWLMYFKDAAGFCHSDDDRTLDLFAASTSVAPMMLQSLCFPGNYDMKNDFKAITFWKEIKPFFLDGDYYLLSPEKFGKDCWTVFQFHDPESGKGIMRFIRNEECEDESITVFPRGIKTDRNYILRDCASGREENVSGKNLVFEGLVQYLAKRDFAFVAYCEA